MNRVPPEDRTEEAPGLSGSRRTRHPGVPISHGPAWSRWDVLLVAAAGVAVLALAWPTAGDPSPARAALAALATVTALAWSRFQSRPSPDAVAEALRRAKSQAEADLRPLRRAQGWLDAIAEALPLGVVVCDRDNAPTFANREWLRLAGFDSVQLGPETLFAPAHPEDRSHVADEWCRRLREGRRDELIFRLAPPRGEEPGPPHWCEVRTVPRPDGQGLVMVWEDITRRVEAAEALQRAKVQAETANRSKSDFLAHMSHEIRTPLAGILGHAEMLADAATSPPDRRRLLGHVRRGGSHLKQIIDDILDLTKIEIGRLELEWLPSPPWQAVQETLSTLQAQADDKGIELIARAETPLPPRLRTDPTRLRQILFNLVSNAIKFSECGSVRIQVALEPNPSPPADGNGHADAPDAPVSWLRFDVEDQGIGMTPDQLRFAFIPFQQGDGSVTRRYGGTGLGLSISRKLATALKGSLSVKSEVGAGSTFSLRLPVQAEEATAARTILDGRPGTEANEAPPLPLPVPALRGRVLLAEDSEDIRRIIRYYLARAGVEMVAAENGRVALEMLDREPDAFELVLMDMQMPELDGYEATRALRRRGHAGPILALTAQAMRDDREKCLEAGCTDYLTKPIDRDALYQMLARFLTVPAQRN